ncbi:MAG: hypothetical protein WAW80_00270 [Candidatus Saccharimonadales bacterium]
MKTYNILFEDGAEPEPHEIQTVLFLRKTGMRVKFLAPKNQPGVKTPDIAMDGMMWEIKSPQSKGSRTIEHAVRSASKQSENIIIDLRRLSVSTDRAMTLIKFHSLRRTNIKRLIVITKDGKKLDIK